MLPAWRKFPAKISTEQWTLITAQGDPAQDVTDAAVDSIRHPFNSLQAAEAGASGVPI
jgi:hypothetical protein